MLLDYQRSYIVVFALGNLVSNIIIWDVCKPSSNHSTMNVISSDTDICLLYSLPVNSVTKVNNSWYIDMKGMRET